jgi:hypothetical protein
MRETHFEAAIGKRKITALVGISDYLIAACEDGTTWILDLVDPINPNTFRWKQLPPIPSED